MIIDPPSGDILSRQHGNIYRVHSFHLIIRPFGAVG